MKSLRGFNVPDIRRGDLTVKEGNYRRECHNRWSGEYLQDAVENFEDFEELKPDLIAALRVYRSNPTLEDMSGEHHAGGSLKDFLWKIAHAWAPDRSSLFPLLDFCDGTQKVHLRRGLLIYAKILLKAMEKSDHDCDAQVRQSAWAMSGYRKDGDRWRCICGLEYVYVQDEAEGGGWMAQNRERKRHGTEKSKHHA